MSLRKTIVGQFKNPHGWLGSIAGWIMANRRSNRQRNLWTVDLLQLKPDDRIIEIGCGPGLALEACLAQAAAGEVVGLDHSRTMLDQARVRNAGASSDGRLQLRLESLDELPPGLGPFDKLYSANVVQFLPDRAAAFRKIHALLKPNGIAATTYMPRSKNPSRAEALAMADEIEGHMKVAGFVGIRIEELPLRPVPAVCIIGEHA
ncbi:MAG: class I SAM-dependent methyltransferase [Alphaproteobacteria bacterium]|jgi:cyclopropane fatty-acyl-phospholipid synthase-like methyltransferase|nr:SAM-dependent methyltransferase [Rhodospirillaceae bacterium]MDP6407632.1 class I SAM-dependent methyltransferase [Alphaproteobacteria bacterium]MDP6622484.1 class I SAM-dependent methyltransferase [Alphaproteobacteria bacterium]|tara:strand:+ start:153 stop:767 length:615 start_codon:yes stop_codon:yes gene_type:complete